MIIDGSSLMILLQNIEMSKFELNRKSSSFSFFNYHTASLLEFKGDIHHTRITGRLECRVDQVICPGGHHTLWLSTNGANI